MDPQLSECFFRDCQAVLERRIDVPDRSAVGG
jgi:hypothetical protein